VNVPDLPIVPDRVAVAVLKLRPEGQMPLLDHELELHPLFVKA